MASAQSGDQAANTPSFLAAPLEALASLDRHELAVLALMLGVLAFAVVTAVLLVRARSRSAAAEAVARDEIIALRAECDRSNALLLAEPQVVVVWPASGDEPEFLGDTAIITPIPVPRRVLAFGTWLDAGRAQAMENAVDALRSRGEGFSMALPALSGRYFEAEGRALGGRAVLRLRDVSGAKRELVELTGHYQKLLSDVDTLRTLIEALPAPIWARDRAGKLAWVSPSYIRAVEARDAADALCRGQELLDSAARETAERIRAAGDAYAARLPVIVAGNRRVLDVLDVPTRTGSAGIGIDVTEVEVMRAELKRMVEAHRRTLDRLSIAVAIFTADHRLAFYNAAYRALWGLEASFLDDGPTDTTVLDQLRGARKLTEQVDFREWKSQLHEAYRAIEPKEHWWHLPDGRTLRVVTTPNPEGGVTYLFEDVTERLELERRYDALIRVQGETLDNLSEAVVVFGSDGRLRLHNPSFTRMWRLTPAVLAQRPHIETVIEWCRPLHPDTAAWQALRGAITGIDQREPLSRRFERTDGSVVDCATLPLPDGATLVTFQDVTDTVNVERVLRERNDALEAADYLKNTFVQHVSYELRTPLTNIIGFAHLLDDAVIGPLTDKQREYLGYIGASSAALLAIINNILDLATIDAGAMTLDLGPVDIRKAMEAAAEGVRDRLDKKGIVLDLRAEPDIGSFTADERRVRQVLYNLLSNAVGFSPQGGTVTLAAERRAEAIMFTVADHGRGIPPEILGRVFERFETHSLGSDHRGAGLGLAIVRSLVELHGGKAIIDSTEGRGTTVSCIFPIERAIDTVAAE